MAETGQQVKKVRAKEGTRGQVGRAINFSPPQETLIKAKIKAAHFRQEAKGAVNIPPGLISAGINTCGATSRSKPRAQATESPPDGDRNVTATRGLIFHLPQRSTPAACSPRCWYKPPKPRNRAGLIFNRATRAPLTITQDIFTAYFRGTPALESFHKTSHPCSA